MQQYKWASCTFYTEHELMSLWVNWWKSAVRVGEYVLAPFNISVPWRASNFRHPFPRNILEDRIFNCQKGGKKVHCSWFYSMFSENDKLFLTWKCPPSLSPPFKINCSWYVIWKVLLISAALGPIYFLPLLPLGNAFLCKSKKTFSKSIWTKPHCPSLECFSPHHG